MPYLDRSGVQLHYEIHGDRTSALPPLLLTHGYRATSEMWGSNVPALVSNRSVITWDMRGHGKSDSPSDLACYSHEHSVADMTALLDMAGADKAVIAGMSLGGYMSLAFHLRHPERVAGLILVDTGPGYRHDEPREAWNAWAVQLAEAFESKGLDALGTSSEVLISHHRSAAGLALAARGMLTQKDSAVSGMLAEIKVPTLVIVGSEDHEFLRASEVMAAKIPGASRVVIERAGHGANVDQPDIFNAAVLDFLKAV